jgi:flavin-dependent thymidylate synthase
MNNIVEYIGHYGDDRTIAQSAWTSTSRELTDSKIDRIPDLLKMLADNGHLTPFEKSSLHFLVTVDQATHIHLLKHRIGVSINGESARYKELKEDKIYAPDDWHGNQVTNKWFLRLIGFSKLANENYHNCLSELTPVIGRKRAKETARYFKTMNSQITMDVMFNFRSFVHFYNLRYSPDAQEEIRHIAYQMLQHIKSIEGNPFQHTLKAFNL